MFSLYYKEIIVFVLQRNHCLYTMKKSLSFKLICILCMNRSPEKLRMNTNYTTMRQLQANIYILLILHHLCCQLPNDKSQYILVAYRLFKMQCSDLDLAMKRMMTTIHLLIVWFERLILVHSCKNNPSNASIQGYYYNSTYAQLVQAQLQ